MEIDAQKAALEKLLRDKEWLLGEIHHRVKNILQIVISLLNAQSIYLDNPDAINAIRSSERRMHAISLIHQKLYQTSNPATIDMQWYIRELIAYMKDNFGCASSILFSLDTQSLDLDVAQAVPLGLILNEAISNSVKYAFPPGRQGEISITLRQEYEQQSAVPSKGNREPEPQPPTHLAQKDEPQQAPGPNGPRHKPEQRPPAQDALQPDSDQNSPTLNPQALVPNNLASVANTLASVPNTLPHEPNLLAPLPDVHQDDQRQPPAVPSSLRDEADQPSPQSDTLQHNKGQHPSVPNLLPHEPNLQAPLPEVHQDDQRQQPTFSTTLRDEADQPAPQSDTLQHDEGQHSATPNTLHHEPDQQTPITDTNQRDPGQQPALPTIPRHESEHHPPAPNPTQTEPACLWRLHIADNGMGLPIGFDIDKTSSLGMSLIRGLSQQLGAALEVQGVPGTAITVIFPCEQDALST